MPKPGNRSANRLVIRFVTAKLKAATQRLRNRIRRMGASRIARSEMMAVISIVALILTMIVLHQNSDSVLNCSSQVFCPSPFKDERWQPISGGISSGKQNRNEESVPIYTIAQYQVKPSGTEKVKGAIEEFVRYVKAN